MDVNVVTPKTSILSDLKKEIGHLKSENKKLARELHLERYSKKMGQQNKLIELRADNQRVDQENAAIRFRVDSVTRQAIARENVTALRREQMKQITEEMPKINDEIREYRSKTEDLRHSNEMKAAQLNAKKIAINDVVSKLKGSHAKREQVNARRDTLDGKLRKSKVNLEREDEKLAVTTRQEKDASSKFSQLKKTTEKAEEDVKAANVKKKRLGEDLQKMKCATELNKSLLEEDGANLTKCESLISAMKQTPRRSSATQTSKLTDCLNPEFSINTSSALTESAEGLSNGCERPKSICRVSGAFGSDVDGSGRKRVEVHAENYDTYTDVNIRLNN